MSGSRQQQLEHNYDKKECKEVNGDWNKNKGGCTFYEDEQQEQEDLAEQLPVIEDYSNTVTTNDEESQKLKYEQLADSSTNPNEVVEQILAEENEQKEITPEEADEINEQNEEVSEQEEEEDEPEEEDDNSDSVSDE
jgi:hypothetical protein